jgi:hypothetical protein
MRTACFIVIPCHIEAIKVAVLSGFGAEITR